MNGESAVIAVDSARRRLTLETWPEVITYETCSDFTARSGADAALSLSDLRPGDFATIDIDSSKPCLRRVLLTEPPTPPECNDAGISGSGEVHWNGFNDRAHSVLFTPTGSGQRGRAMRWCNPPKVVDSDGVAITLAQVPRGAMVKLLDSTDGWLVSLEVVSE